MFWKVQLVACTNGKGIEQTSKMTINSMFKSMKNDAKTMHEKVAHSGKEAGCGQTTSLPRRGVGGGPFYHKQYQTDSKHTDSKYTNSKYTDCKHTEGKNTEKQHAGNTKRRQQRHPWHAIRASAVADGLLILLRATQPN